MTKKEREKIHRFVDAIQLGLDSCPKNKVIEVRKGLQKNRKTCLDFTYIGGQNEIISWIWIRR